MSESLLTSLKKVITEHNPARIVVGFSGGLDSSALLNALVELKAEESNSAVSEPSNRLLKHTAIIAIHVHHGLSKNADDWLVHCQDFCDARDVALLTERVTLDTQQGSLENAARNARYEVFARHIKKGDALFLAHHQNDQVETFMMRLMRGSGLTGLSAMQLQRAFSNGSILRPWLYQTRGQLEEYVTLKGVTYIEDESNADTQFDRNWWRHTLLPKLSARYPQASTSIVRSIEVLQQERQLLQDLLAPIYRHATNVEMRYSPYPTMNCEVLLAQPKRVQTQLIRMWLQQQSVYPALNNTHMDVLFTDVVNAKYDATPIYQWQQHQIRRYAGKLFLLPGVSVDVSSGGAEVRDSDVSIRQAISICASQAEVSRVTTNAGFQSIALTGSLTGFLNVSESVKNGLRAGNYEVVSYRAGLTAKPLKRPTKTLKKWFQEFGVPPWLRDSWPVIIKDEQVVCVPSLFVCEGFTADVGWDCDYQSLANSLHLNTF